MAMSRMSIETSGRPEQLLVSPVSCFVRLRVSSQSAIKVFLRIYSRPKATTPRHASLLRQLLLSSETL